MWYYLKCGTRFRIDGVSSVLSHWIWRVYSARDVNAPRDSVDSVGSKDSSPNV